MRDGVRHRLIHAQFNLARCFFVGSEIFTNSVNSDTNKPKILNVALNGKGYLAHEQPCGLRKGGNRLVTVVKHAKYLVHSRQLKHAHNSGLRGTKHKITAASDELENTDESAKRA